MARGVRIIENASRRMQRLGYLKLLLNQASTSSTSTLRTLGTGLIDAVTRKVAVPPNSELADYLRITLAGQPDKSMLRQFSEPSASAKPTNMMVQIQDAYLSSRRLPSQRGRLVLRDSTNYPRLGTSLGLLREDLYTPLVRGQVLLNLVAPSETAAFREYSDEVNPLLLSQEQRFFFLYTIIKSDTDIIVPLFRQLLVMDDDFADYEAGNLLPGIIRQFVKDLRERVSSGADAMRLRQFLRTAEAIERWRDREYKAQGVRDETITVRLEPLVDIGVLVKNDPFAYRYRFSSLGRHLMTLLTEVGDNTDIDTKFFEHTVTSHGLDLQKLSTASDQLPFIYESFARLKSPLGYAPINDVMLLGTLLAIRSNQGYFELEEGVQSVRAIQRQYPNLVRFNVDRMGKLNFIKFEGPVHR